VSEAADADARPRIPVTVIVPAYERAALLDRALGSIAAQTVAPEEVIVVDDASTDATAAVALAAGARVITHAENAGAATARNTGFAAARTAWVALLDSDDEWLPHHLERTWAARAGHVLVSGSCLVIGTDGAVERAAGPAGWHDRVLRRPADLVYPENPVVASGALVDRAAVLRAGGYDTTLRYAEDFDLWTRVLEQGTARCLAEVTVLIRQHGERKSARRDRATAAQGLIAARVATDRRGRLAARRRLGVRRWDDLRAALRDGHRRAAAAPAAAIVRDPQALAGLVGVLAWRYRCRRRGRALRPDGSGRIAVLPGAPLPAVPAEDWRERSAARRVAGLVTAPPRQAIAASRADRALCRLAGVATSAPPS
jgi:GT2 family glycosyltransferase